MPPTTERTGTGWRRTLRFTRARLDCCAGPDAGSSWSIAHGVLRIGSDAGCDVVLRDPAVSHEHAELERTAEGYVLRDLDSSNGTWVNGLAVREVVLAPGTRIRVGNTTLGFAPEHDEVEVEPSTASRLGALVGTSPAMRETYALVARLALTDASVVITGETGTGKELVARALHERGSRGTGPFEVFDAASVPAALAAAELFGYERGAFTGAEVARAGVFERARGGTVLLDNLGDLPLDLQPSLLRVLDRREVRRLGAPVPLRVDVRVLATTHRDLRAEVDAKRFRSDLFFRVSVAEVHVAPLRERLEDLPLLVDHFLRRAQVGTPRVAGMSDDVHRLLRSWRWPGNVRELANVVERAVPFCTGDRIDLAALPPALAAQPSPAREPTVAPTPRAELKTYRTARQEIIDAFERRFLLDLMERHGGVVSKAAHATGLHRDTLARLLRKHKIGPAR